jgi:ParB-like chromosome segregation protein Spo0J
VGDSFQVLAPLRPEELEALARDISHRGVLVPVEVDERGRILDGHPRVAIARKLGAKYKTVSRRFASDSERVEHALKLNILRRHLGPVSWAQAFGKL